MTASAPVAPRSAPDAEASPLLETRGLTKHFKIGGTFSRRTLHAVDDVDIVIGRKRDRRAGRRERQRQVDDRPAARPGLPADRRRDPLPGPLAGRDAHAPADHGLPRRRTDGLPGSVQLAQPGLPRLARHHARAEAAPPGSGPNQPPDRGGTCRGRGRAHPGHRCPRPLPARTVRRPAPAHRVRAGARVPAEADPRRRAGVHARRLDPHRAAQRDGEAAGRGGRLVPLHHARHRERPLRRRPADGDVRRAYRRVGADRGRARPPEAPVHAAASVGRAGPASAASRRRRVGQGRAAAGHRPGRGLPVPLALPVRDRYLFRRDSAAAPAGRCPHCGMPRRARRQRSGVDRRHTRREGRIRQ